MTYRQTTFAPYEHYHLYNRGNNKQQIFHSDDDYTRFLFNLLHFQSHVTFPEISKRVHLFKKTGEFGISQEVRDRIISKRYVALVGFCLMPNHFHLIVQEVSDGGVSKYMQRILNAYSKYANKKYPEKHIGHIFQGSFKSVREKTNEQLLHLSAYVHRNPKEIKRWSEREKRYPWSSFQDFIGTNRWGNLLLRDVILDQFRGGRDYESFVDTSIAKEEHNKLLLDDDIILEAHTEEDNTAVVIV